MANNGIGLAEAAAMRRGARGRGGDGLSAMMTVFPLLVVPVLIYNFVGFLGSVGENGPEKVRANMEAVAMAVPMASGATWEVSWGAILLLISLSLLFVELLKSTGTGSMAIFNHALSMLVFILCLIEFLLLPAFATSTFFLIMTMSLLDVLAGVIVTIVSARRDVEFEH